MILSMTGYGKAEAILPNGKLTVEIRSVNGKNADIGIKTSLLPKDKEIEVRKRLSDKLIRGTIDLFITWEPGAENNTRNINMDAAEGHIRQIRELVQRIGGAGCGLDGTAAAVIAGAVLKMPDVMESAKNDVINEDNWQTVDAAINKAIDSITAYRSKEGEALYADVTSRVRTILNLYDRIEQLEPERIDAIRTKLTKAAQELQVRLDPERFEQEMIFYLEKLDINEEKVRLRQHCKYFLDTIDGEPFPGKKLGFIIQEMGREINTTGSKANDASIQECVVRMKDELEKIREQSLNIL